MMPTSIGQLGAVERDVGAAARPDPRHLGLVVQLLGPDRVGPDAGRVDDVVGADLELARRTAASRTRTPSARPLLVDQAEHLAAVGHHGAEALGLAQHGQHQPHVVGLAVVEEVGGARLALGQRGGQPDDLLAVDHAVAVGAPVGRAVAVASRAAAARARRRARAPSRRTCSGRRRQRARGRLPSNEGTSSSQRAHQVRREVDQDRPLEQRLAHQAEVEVLQVAQPAVHELGRAAGGADRVVLALDQRDAVAARGRVERDARAGDARRR